MGVTCICALLLSSYVSLAGAEEKILGEFRDTYNPAASDFHLQAMIQSAGKLVLIGK